MIGKPQWFARRKYTGWGFTPSTWQGWVYLLVIIIPFVLLQSLPIGDNLKLILGIVWAVIFIADFIDIMIHLKKDERDRLHEALAERNALWVIIAVLITGIGFQTAVGVASGVVRVDPIILIALIAGVIAKAITNMYLERKG
ncbi:MAG: hypothetical protein WC757_04710 [Candidatus Paceibacterota bacterium]|jgi:hypothetical protein